VTTLAGLARSTGTLDGVGSNARFNNPNSIGMNAGGSLALVADTYNNLVRRLVISSGSVTTLAGSAGTSGSTDGVGALATFTSPRGISVDAYGSFALVVSRDDGRRKEEKVAREG